MHPRAKTHDTSPRRRRDATVRRGLTLVEAALALALTGIVFAGVFAMFNSFSRDRDERIAADRTEQIAKAAEEYLRRYGNQLTQAADGRIVRIPVAATVDSMSTPADVALPAGAGTVPSLQGSGLLSTDFVDTTPFRQTHAFIVRKVPSSKRLEALVVAVGGQNLEDSRLGRIAKRIGAAGGFVPKTPTGDVPAGTVIGTDGGWATASGLWSSAGVGPEAGHQAVALALNEGRVVGDFISRHDTGDAESARMRTDLDMGSNEIRDVAAIGTLFTLNETQSVVEARQSLEVEAGIHVGRDAAVTGNIDAVRDLTAGSAVASGAVVAGRDVSAADDIRVSGTARAEDEAKAERLFSDAGRLLDPNGKSLLAEVGPAKGGKDAFDVDTVVYGSRVDAIRAAVASAGNVAADPSRTLGSYLRQRVTLRYGYGSSSVPPSVNSATVYCEADEVRIACDGSRAFPIADNCDEQSCGLVGTLPVNTGTRQGCQTVIDYENGKTNPTAVAYCMTNVLGGRSEMASSVPSAANDTPKKPEPTTCPVWAPGTYPNCIYPAPAQVCPAWAPGTYPNCVVNSCPTWAPGIYPNCDFRKK